MGIQPATKEDSLPGTPMELADTVVGNALGTETESIFIINDFKYHHQYIQRSTRTSPVTARTSPQTARRSPQTPSTHDERKRSTPNVSNSENESRSSFSSIEDAPRRPSQPEVRQNKLLLSIDYLYTLIAIYTIRMYTSRDDYLFC